MRSAVSEQATSSGCDLVQEAVSSTFEQAIQVWSLQRMRGTRGQDI